MTSLPLTQPNGPRDIPRAMGRGCLGRCPNCGEGPIFRAYLKVADECSTCGEALHHQRADDAPPYVTMFIVAHVVVTLILSADALWPEAPLWLEAVGFCVAAAVLSLVLLPRVKGTFVGLQWGLRMHGFGAAPAAGRQI